MYPISIQGRKSEFEEGTAIFHLSKDECEKLSKNMVTFQSSIFPSVLSIAEDMKEEACADLHNKVINYKSDIYVPEENCILTRAWCAQIEEIKADTFQATFHFSKQITTPLMEPALKKYKDYFIQIFQLPTDFEPDLIHYTFLFPNNYVAGVNVYNYGKVLEISICKSKDGTTHHVEKIDNRRLFNSMQEILSELERIKNLKD